MTAQVFSSTMSQHPFPSAYSSPMASPSPSKENHFPSYPSYPASASSSKDAASTSSHSDAERSRTSLLETSRANELPAPRSQRGTSSRRPSRPRLHSLQSLNSGPASPSLTEQDSGHAYISTARFLSTHPSLSRASSRNAVETLQPLAESGGSAGSVDAQTKPGESSSSSHARRNPEAGLSEFGQMGAPFGERNAASGAFLRRSHTVTSGISAMGSKRMEEAPFRRSPPESAVTFGARSGRTPKLGARRQTASNVSPTPVDRPEVKRTNTTILPPLSYSPTPDAAGSTLSVAPSSTLRPRPTLPPNQLEAKVVILGSQGVGKTSLVHRYTSGQFTLSSTPSTIGASFLTKKLIVDSVKVRLQLWDTAGQERFRSMAPMYYRGSHAAVIVYDITSLASFWDVRGWLDELRRNMTGTGLVVHVVGAKGDLARAAREVELGWARGMVRSWLEPVAVGEAEGSPTHGASSRLSGLGSLAMGSASRAFASSTGWQPAPKAASTASTASGSTTSDTPRDTPLDSDGTLAWDAVEVSEVSAKSDRGIEEVFLAVTQKLVERRAQIEQERKARERNSIFLSASEVGDPEAGGEAITVNSWTCCG